MGTTQLQAVSKAMTPTSFRSSRISTTSWAASFASSIFESLPSPVVSSMLPDRSMTKAMAREGISTFWRASMVTGSASSIGVR